MVIYNIQLYMGHNHPMLDGWVQIKDGKIEQLGDLMHAPPDDSIIIDGKDGILIPGYIDAHTHIGIIESGLNFEGDDCNEVSDPFAPHLRALDAINPFDPYFREAVLRGITTVAVSPGSANPCGGQICAVKTAGRCIDDMLIKTVGIKFALGENPKTVYNDRDETPNTRMGTVAVIREGLFKAQRYMQQIESAIANDDELPEFDMKGEALIPLLKREIKAHFHCHRADDICTAIRIIKEFNLDGVIVHGTEAHLIPDIIKSAGVSVITGPALCDRGKPEMKNLSVETTKVMAENGILYAICSDHPVIPINRMHLNIIPLVYEGKLSPHQTLEGLTAYPAKILGINDRIGKLDVGMDADFVLYPTSPLNPCISPVLVIINGEIKFADKDFIPQTEPKE